MSQSGTRAKALFVVQRIHRVDARRAPSRDVVGNQSDGQKQGGDSTITTGSSGSTPYSSARKAERQRRGT